MEDETETNCCRFCNCPKRYVTVALACMVIFCNYVSRDTLPITFQVLASVAARQTHHNHTYIDCPHLKALSKGPALNITSPKLYNFHTSTIHSISEYFYSSYILGQFLGGLIVDRIGPKHLLSGCLFFSAILTLFTPVILYKTGGSATAVKIVRLFHGTFQALVLPAVVNILAHWVPRRERGVMSGIIYCSLFLAQIGNNVVMGLALRKAGDWALPYYIFGGISIGVVLIWQIFGFSNPYEDPYITNKEIRYIDKLMGNTVEQRTMKTVPLRRMVLSLDIWALILAFIGHLFIWNVMVAFLPQYIKRVLHFDIKKSTNWGVAPFAIIGTTSILFGILSDYLVNTGRVNIVTMRKVCTNVGLMGPAVYIIGASYAGCHQVVAQFMFMIAVGSVGAAFVGIRLVPIDISPNYSGTLTAFANGFGTVAGMFATRIISEVVPNKRLVQFRKLFVICFAVSFCTNLCFVIFGKTDEKDWNRPTRVVEVEPPPPTTSTRKTSDE